MDKLAKFLCVLMLVVILPMHAMAEEDDEDAAKPKKPTGPEIVELKPLTLPVINDKGLTQQVSLLVSIEVPQGKTDVIKAAAPKLADAYISDLYGALGNGSAMMKGGIIDVNAVKEHLVADTTKVLGGADKFNAVYLDVMQQSRR